MAPNTLRAKDAKVTLRGEEEKARWKRLAALETAPSRYPSWYAIYGLGIETSWNALVEAGRLGHLFGEKLPSFKALTVEFLTTLTVTYTPDKIMDSIYFRLVNKEHTITLSEFNAIFHFLGEDEEGYTAEPADYNRDEFWNMITLHTPGQPSKFNPCRAKINSVRNPVLRYLLKALVYLPFAHTEAGSMQSDMLFILWGILRGRRINLGYYIIRHLERQSRKKDGKICCGGVISAIAAHLGVSFEGWKRDMGPLEIDWEALKSAQMVLVDRRGIGYFLQYDKIHFKFPNPQLSAVGGWTYKDNWLMETPAHLHGFLTDPPQGTAAPNVNPNIVGMGLMPEPEVPAEPPQLEGAAQRPEEEEAIPTTGGGEGSSRQKRTRLNTNKIEEYLRNLQLGQDQAKEERRQIIEQNTTLLAQQSAHWNQYQSDYQGVVQWQAQHDAYQRQAWDGIHQWQAQQDAYRQAESQEARDWRTQYNARMEAYEQQQRAQWEAQEQWRCQYQPPPQ